MKILAGIIVLLFLGIVGVLGVGLFQNDFNMGQTMSWIQNGFTSEELVQQDDFDALLDEFLIQEQLAGSGDIMDNMTGSLETGSMQTGDSLLQENEVMTGSLIETGMIITGTVDNSLDQGNNSESMSDKMTQVDILEKRLKQYQEFKVSLDGTGSYQMSGSNQQVESTNDFVIEVIEE